MDFTSTEETVAWIKDRYAEGTLTIRPPYQRKPVWMARQKCNLIESILKAFPIPEIFVQRSTDEAGKTTYAVVDGQQRVRTLLQFFGASEDEDDEFDQFTLDKLEVTSPWYGESFGTLPSEDRRRIYGYELAVRYLNSDDEEEMKEVFRRLNRYTSPLKPQELRHATYEGPFARLTNKLADDHSDFLAENRIVTVGAIRRMADVELIAELLIGLLHGPQGGSAARIDEYYQQYEDYEDDFPGERAVKRRFERTIEAIERAMPQLRDYRWSNKSDFYTLFVALGRELPERSLTDRAIGRVSNVLKSFAAEVEERLIDDQAPAQPDVVNYVRNVQRAPNEKSRRVGRHQALTNRLSPVLR